MLSTSIYVMLKKIKSVKKIIAKIDKDISISNQDNNLKNRILRSSINENQTKSYGAIN